MTNPTECRIYEFSTGIVPDFDSDGRWFSRRFTGNYMNVSLPGGTIPHEVQRAIANELFQVVEGEEDNPAIVGRVVPGSPTYSVVALATLGRDEINRPIAVYRYFLCEGKYNLWKILAWLKRYQQQHDKKLPIFNPGDTRQEGDDFSPPTDSRPPNMTLDAADERLIEPKDIPILIEEQQQQDFQQVHILAMNKAGRVNQPVSWAYNVEGLEKPNRFVIIHAASNDACKQIKAQIRPSQQQLQLANVGVHDEKALESAMKNITTSGRVKEQHAQVIAQVINNDQVTEQHWQQLFKAQGADSAGKVSSAPMARLLTLRAMVIPERLPDLLRWIDLKPNKSYKETFSEFQLELYHQVEPLLQQPEEAHKVGKSDHAPTKLDNKLADGLIVVLDQMMQNNCQPQTVVKLLQGRKSAWKNCFQSLTENITQDFAYIVEINDHDRARIKQKIDSHQPVNELRCNPVIWERLLAGYKLDYYLPLATFFQELKKWDLASFFYQISQGKVPDKTFIAFFRQLLGDNQSQLSNPQLYNAGEWRIRQAIYNNDHQIKFESITLIHERTCKDHVITFCNWIIKIFLSIIKRISTAIQWCFRKLSEIAVNNKRNRDIGNGKEDSGGKAETQKQKPTLKQKILRVAIVSGTIFGLLLYLAPKLLNLAETGINPLKNIPWFSGNQNVPDDIMKFALQSNNLKETAKWIEEIQAELLRKELTQPNITINQAVCLNLEQKCDLSLILANNEEPQSEPELKEQIKNIYLYQQAKGIDADGMIGLKTAKLLLQDALKKSARGDITPWFDFELKNALEKFDTTKAELSEIVKNITDDLQGDDIKTETINALKTALQLKEVEYTGIIVEAPGLSTDRIDKNRKLWLEGINTFQLQLEGFAGQYGVITDGSQTSTELKKQVKSLVEEQLKKLPQESESPATDSEESSTSQEDNGKNKVEMTQAKMDIASNSYSTTKTGIKDVVERTYNNIRGDSTLSDKLKEKFGPDYSKNSAIPDSSACKLKKKIVEELESVLFQVASSSPDCKNLGNIPVEEDKTKWVTAIYNYQKDKVDTLVADPKDNEKKIKYKDNPANPDGIVSSGGITANHLVDTVTEQFKQNLVAP